MYWSVPLCTEGCRYIGLIHIGQFHYVQRGAGVLVNSIIYRGEQVYLSIPLYYVQRVACVLVRYIMYKLEQLYFQIDYVHRDTGTFFDYGDVVYGNCSAITLKRLQVLKIEALECF